MKSLQPLTGQMRTAKANIASLPCDRATHRTVQHTVQRWRKRSVQFVLALLGPLLIQGVWQSVWPATLSQAQAQSGGSIQMKASRVEANSNTGVVTATGNVRIDYPSRQIYATSAQAQYYSKEQKIILSGNVDVLQEGNSLRAETVTYLIEEGRFVATPNDNEQVEAVYILPEPPPSEPAANSAPEAAPQPVAIPSVPDELPDELGPINSPNSF